MNATTGHGGGGQPQRVCVPVQPQLRLDHAGPADPAAPDKGPVSAPRRPLLRYVRTCARYAASPDERDYGAGAGAFLESISHYLVTAHPPTHLPTHTHAHTHPGEIFVVCATHRRRLDSPPHCRSAHRAGSTALKPLLFFFLFCLCVVVVVVLVLVVLVLAVLGSSRCCSYSCARLLLLLSSS